MDVPAIVLETVGRECRYFVGLLSLEYQRRKTDQKTMPVTILLAEANQQSIADAVLGDRSQGGESSFWGNGMEKKLWTQLEDTTKAAAARSYPQVTRRIDRWSRTIGYLQKKARLFCRRSRSCDVEGKGCVKWRS